MTKKEESRLNFTSKQALEALLLQNEIKEGVWQFGVEFGFGAGNVATDSSGKNVTPSAMIGVTGVTIVEVDKIKDNLSVDAAELWKAKKGGTSRTPRKAAPKE